MKRLVYFFLAWRVLLFLPLVVGHLFFTYNTNTPYTSLWNFTKPYPPVDNFLLSPWANFDGVHYLSIAGNGYAVDGSNARFFPFFPMIIRGISQIFGGGIAFGAVQFFSSLFLTNLFFLLALTVFYKLVRLDFSHKAAIGSIVFLLIFPTSFFFAGIYSESLFLLLLLLSFYFARKRQWLLAGLFGSLLSVTRVVGIAILPALVWEFYRGDKGKPQLIKFFSLTLIPLGLIGYMLFNLYKWGNAFVFFLAHGQVGNQRSVTSIVLPIQTFFRYLKILVTVPTSQFTFWIALLEATIFIGAAFFLFLVWKKKINSSYLLFSIVAFLVSTISGSFNGLPRYVIILFPIFIALALLKNKLIKITYAVISLILLFILLMFFSRGYFIA